MKMFMQLPQKKKKKKKKIMRGGEEEKDGKRISKRKALLLLYFFGFIKGKVIALSHLPSWWQQCTPTWALPGLGAEGGPGGNEGD